MTVDAIIDGIIRKEGGYTNNPNDRGGETCWGITVAVARSNAYTGPMKDLPQATAREIYKQQYYFGPQFHRVSGYSMRLAEELTDTGVNMGVVVAGHFLQRALNAMNRQGALYPDMKVDGYIGNGTLAALAAFMKARGVEGEAVLLRALNCLQGSRYIEQAEGRPANEDFVYGWIKERVA